jgi:pyruvate formate lyase activating enzyme
MTVSEVLATVTKDMEYYRKSGGGLTISGGEPLCQSEFCAELAKATKAENITVAIDTSGFVNWNAFERVLPYADLFLLDIKHVSDEKHKRVVGVSNELILQNAKKLAASGSSIWIRVPVIPQFNDSDADSRAIAEFIGGLGGGVEQVQVLPYHNLGTYKYERIFWRKPIFEAPTHKDERIHEILEIYKSSGVETRLH